MQDEGRLKLVVLNEKGIDTNLFYLSTDIITATNHKTYGCILPPRI